MIDRINSRKSVHSKTGQERKIVPRSQRLVPTAIFTLPLLCFSSILTFRNVKVIVAFDYLNVAVK